MFYPFQPNTRMLAFREVWLASPRHTVRVPYMRGLPIWQDKPKPQLDSDKISSYGQELTIHKTGMSTCSLLQNAPLSRVNIENGSTTHFRSRHDHSGWWIRRHRSPQYLVPSSNDDNQSKRESRTMRWDEIPVTELRTVWTLNYAQFDHHFKVSRHRCDTKPTHRH